MVSRHETYRKFLRIVVGRLPTYITKSEYTSNEQLLLEDFRLLLEDCESKAYIDRKSLSKQLYEFSLKIRSRPDYNDLSFLWFCADYISNANMLLNVADFHAEDFYQYLVTHLRNSSGLTGVFQLIRDKTPFNDPNWEKVQYACVTPPSLNEDELECLKTIQGLVFQKGIESLNPANIRAAIAERTNPRNIKNIVSLLTPLDTYWNLWLLPLAFGIAALIFQFQLNEKTSLQEIIDIHKSENSVLCDSEIFQIRYRPNTYIGIFYVPDHLSDHLIEYFHHCEQIDLLILQKESVVTDMRFSSSLTRYQSGKGWKKFTKTELTRLRRILTTNRPQNIHFDVESFFLSSPFNHNWDFRKHTNPIRAAELYCRIPRKFTFNTLPYGFQHQQQTNLTKREKAHLKELHNNQVVKATFRSNRLIFAFSLDLTWIILPKISLEQLSGLLTELPNSYILITEKEIHIWSVLPPNLAKMLKNELNWAVLPIITTPQGCGCDINHFCGEKMKWNIPLVLKDISS
jgi:hypothetical protein